MSFLYHNIPLRGIFIRSFLTSNGLTDLHTVSLLPRDCPSLVIVCSACVNSNSYKY